MAELKYKIVLFSQQIYKEFPLPDKGRLIIGTTNRCAIRFDEEDFLDSFEILVEKTGTGWVATASRQIYFSNDTMMKFASVELEQAGKVSVAYRQNVNAPAIFTMELIVDFEQHVSRYDRVIVLEPNTVATIGGRLDCNIYIADEALRNDCISIARENGTWTVRDRGTRFGVYINGARCDTFPCALKDGDFLMLSGYSFFLKYDSLYTEASEIIKINNIQYYDTTETKSALSYPKFVLSTRVKKVFEDEDIVVLPPKAKEKPQKQSLILTLLPTLGMGVATVAMRGMMGGGGNFVYYSIGMVGIGIVTSIITALSDRRRVKKEEKNRQSSYQEYIQKKTEQLRRKQEHELSVLNDNYRSVQDIIDSVYNFDNKLFDRRPDDEDFLDICIGKGEVDATVSVQYNQQEQIDAEDDLLALPDELTKQFKSISYAPIIVKLKDVGAVGVYGPDYQRINLLKQITLETCTRQYFEDVKLYFFMDSETIGEMSWVRWFGHVRSNIAGLPLYNIVCDEESKKAHFEFLYNVLQVRSAQRGNGTTRPHFDTHYVILVYDNFGLYNHPLSKYIDSAADYGFTFVFFERYEELLPRGCKTQIAYDEHDRKGKCINTANGDNTKEFTFVEVNSSDAERVAKRLSPVYADEISLDGNLTKNYTFYDMIGVYSARDIDLLNNWKNHNVCVSMAAPIGIGTDGNLVQLDIRQHVHGPHGLVAGTTGYGKSEIVQSYIISMAMLYSPIEVGFVFVDFKGGGMANLFKNLPHQVGIVTDIDGSGNQADAQAQKRFLDRFMDSLKEESEKRKRLFKECQNNVNHIDDYIKEYRAGRATVPLQHLILVVDEFAELKRASKDFITQIIKIAATGRSLGIHLILATQDPGTSVDDEIQKNSTFALCLKVNKPEDSRKVIDSPLAAEINEPGRAYMHINRKDSKMQLFQSAYSGAKVDGGGKNELKPFRLFKVDIAGRRELIFERKKAKASDEDTAEKATQLSEIINFIDQTVKDNGIKTVSSICLPPLGGFIAYSDRTPVKKSDTEFFSEIGIYDNPAGQYQGPMKISYSRGNTLIVGSQMTGKSNTLQYIVREAAERYTAQQMTFYLIDNAASPSLQTVACFHNVGGIVSKSDDESFKKLIDMLKAELAIRETAFSKVNCDSFRNYVENGYTNFPQIVVLIDNIVAMLENRAELYTGELSDDILYLLRDGVSMGISFVATTMETAHQMYKFMPYFSNHVALFCNDSGEYTEVVGRTNLHPRNTPGRCIVDLNQDIYECQLYYAFDVTESSNRLKMEEIRKADEETRKLYPNSKARAIPFVPEKVTAEHLMEECAREGYGPSVVPVGIRYSNVKVAGIDLAKDSAVFVCNAPKDANGNVFVQYVEQKLCELNSQVPVELYVFDNYEMNGRAAKNLPITKQYTYDEKAINDFMTMIGGELDKRAKMRIEGKQDEIEKQPLIVAVVHNNDCLEEISKNMTSKELYKSLFKKYKGLRVFFLIADVDNEPVSFNAPEPLKIAKDMRHGFIFASVNDIKFIDVDFGVKKMQRKPLGKFDCIYFNGSNVDRVKIANG